MNERPIAIALESGPAGFAALRVAADLAARLSAPLRGFALTAGGIPTLRAHRRLKLVARRRGLEVSFVRPAGSDLLAVSDAAPDARLVVCARPGPEGASGLGRRLAFAALLRRLGPPVLVVPRRGRPLGDRVLIACANGQPDALDPFYALVKPLVGRVSILRWLPSGSELRLDRGLDDCIENALAWDERIVHGDEGHDLADTIRAASDRIRPTLVALARQAEGASFAAFIAPEAVDRAVREASAPVLVPRLPRVRAPSSIKGSVEAIAPQLGAA